MAKSKKTRTVYRDRKTGRFASKATWKRSRARRGKRYARSRLIQPTRTKRKSARPAKLPKKTEYQINVKYAANESSKVEVQISAIGPPNKNREQVLAAVNYYLDDGENLPKWEVHIVFWEKRGKQFFGDDDVARKTLARFLSGSDIEVFDKTKGRSL